MAIPVRFILSFFFTSIVFCCLTVAFDFKLEGWTEIAYCIIMLPTTLWFLKPKDKVAGAIGSVGCGIFWPVSLGTIGLVNLSFKVIPYNKYKWLDKDLNGG